MIEQDNIHEAVIALFLQCKEMYGDAIEKFWFYESKFCPCCSKSKIDTLRMGEELTLSLNGFMYREMNTLIGYLLCSRCVTDLFGIDSKQKSMYMKLEQNLKNAYQSHLKLTAS